MKSIIKLIVNGESVEAAVEAESDPAAILARRPGTYGHEARLRARRLRSMHGDP